MNRDHGLLAFCCTVVAVACALLQLPLVNGLGDAARLISGSARQRSTPLSIALTPPTAAQPATGPGGEKLLTLFDLQREQRADPLLRQLATRHGLDFALLKAHLAQASAGVLGDGGHYWARLPAGAEPVADEGPARSRAAARLLARYRQRTGSTATALVAWAVGPLRAARVARLRPAAGSELESSLVALRRHLLAPQRQRARSWLCTVTGLAACLRARWPVTDRDLSVREGKGVRLAAAPGEKVRAPMAGRVGFAGADGARGRCVELRHACGLLTEICDLHTTAVAAGRWVARGAPLGSAGRRRPRLNLVLGVRALDAAQLMPAEAPYPGSEARPVQRAPALEAVDPAAGEPAP
jgi:murein DD-endopeptidase MepM/ murein hydrolase activator NlpD